MLPTKLLRSTSVILRLENLVSPLEQPTPHATTDDSKGIVELSEVNESEFSEKARAAGAAATAGVSEGITGLLEVTESEFPSLSNSVHSSNPCLGSSTSACVSCCLCCCFCSCLPCCVIFCGVCCCCTRGACVDPARCTQFRWYWWTLACAEVDQLLPGQLVVGHG